MKHEWFVPKGFPYQVCRNCGIVKPLHGREKPCKGKVKVVFRNGRMYQELVDPKRR